MYGLFIPPHKERKERHVILFDTTLREHTFYNGGLWENIWKHKKIINTFVSKIILQNYILYEGLMAIRNLLISEPS